MIIARYESIQLRVARKVRELGSLRVNPSGCAFPELRSKRTFRASHAAEKRKELHGAEENLLMANLRDQSCEPIISETNCV